MRMERWREEGRRGGGRSLQTKGRPPPKGEEAHRELPTTRTAPYKIPRLWGHGGERGRNNCGGEQPIPGKKMLAGGGKEHLPFCVPKSVPLGNATKKIKRDSNF